MQRRELNLFVDWILLSAALMAFTTGIVLLACFHVGEGAFAISALGQSKLIWLNLHRFSAAVAALGVVTHVGLHWRAFRITLTNVLLRRAARFIAPRSGRASSGRGRSTLALESVMYAAFLVAAFTGLVAWSVLAGSSPIFGSAAVGLMNGSRHQWIDTHLISSLVSLVLIAHHVGHRWRFMTRWARPPLSRRENAGGDRS